MAIVKNTPNLGDYFFQQLLNRNSTPDFLCREVTAWVKIANTARSEGRPGDLEVAEQVLLKKGMSSDLRTVQIRVLAATHDLLEVAREALPMKRSVVARRPLQALITKLEVFTQLLGDSISAGNNTTSFQRVAAVASIVMVAGLSAVAAHWGYKKHSDDQV